MTHPADPTRERKEAVEESRCIAGMIQRCGEPAEFVYFGGVCEPESAAEMRSLAYLAERLIIKPQPTSAESILRWRMTVFAMDAADAFRPAAEAVSRLAEDFMEIAEGMEAE